MTEVAQSETSIGLGESGYGSGQHAVIVLSAKTKRALKKEVASRNYRLHNGDRPGQAFAVGCKAIRYCKGDYQWDAVCISSVYYDV